MTSVLILFITCHNFRLVRLKEEGSITEVKEMKKEMSFQPILRETFK